MRPIFEQTGNIGIIVNVHLLGHYSEGIAIFILEILPHISNLLLCKAFWKFSNVH